MESRNAKLKVIVDTAKVLLGVTYVTVEMVVDMLNNLKGALFQHDIDQVKMGCGGLAVFWGVEVSRDLLFYLICLVVQN